jgi:transposase-like protein
MRRRYSAAEKEAAVQRVAAGEAVGSVARRQGIDPKRLYEWYGKYQAGGREALQATGRPRKQARPAARAPARPSGQPEVAALRRQVSEQQRKIGEQEIDLDFFRRALRQLEEARRMNATRGGAASTKSSKR